MELQFLLEIQRTLTSPAGDRIMIALSGIGDHGLIWIAVALALCASPRQRRAGIGILLALLLAHLLGNVFLKNLIARPRPYLAYPEIVLKIPPLNEYSFPSGHTITAFAAVFSLPRSLGALKRALAVLAVGIACSRLYLFMHYPTDILGGALLGMVIGYSVTCVPWFKVNKCVDKPS